MWMSLASLAPRPALPAPGGSLYRAWAEAPAAAMARLDAAAFSLAEAAEMEAWAEAQARWGLSLRLRRDLCGVARLAEVFGPDGCAPLALLYRSADGRLRVDDFAGETRDCGSVAAALDAVLACA